MFGFGSCCAVDRPEAPKVIASRGGSDCSTSPSIQSSPFGSQSSMGSVWSIPTAAELDLYERDQNRARAKLSVSTNSARLYREEGCVAHVLPGAEGPDPDSKHGRARFIDRKCSMPDVTEASKKAERGSGKGRVSFSDLGALGTESGAENDDDPNNLKIEDEIVQQSEPPKKGIVSKDTAKAGLKAAAGVACDLVIGRRPVCLQAKPRLTPNFSREQYEAEREEFQRRQREMSRRCSSLGDF